MTFFIISALLNALTSGFCGLFVLLNNPKNKTNQTFFYFSLAVCLWSIFQFFWMIETDISEESLLYTRISNLAAILIPPTFFHFSTHLINEYKKHSRSIMISYCIALISLSFGLSEHFISHSEPLMYFPHWPIAGPIFTLAFLEYILISGYALFIIYKKIKSSRDPERLQLKYVFYGILIAYIGGSLNYPLCYRIPIAPITNILIPFYTLFITYAALRYKLMNIDVIIKRSLIYTILITTIFIFYFLSIYLAEHFFQETFGYRSLLISLTSAIIIAILFIPFKNIIERILFKGDLGNLADENELLRQEIIRSERLKTIATLASGMAHEIKNPLTPIKTFAEQLPKRMDDKEFLLKFSRIISNEVNRIDTLVGELLDYAKPTPPQLKPTGIHQLIDHTADFLNNDFIKHTITLIKDYQLPTGQLLNIDENQFRQTLLNILLNAIDAMPNGGELEIATGFWNERKCTITIEDTGKGIAPEDISHIFDPFFSKKDRGTGLGLAITHEIIKNHNGKILVDSQLGVGTKFVIELPITHPYETTQ